MSGKMSGARASLENLGAAITYVPNEAAAPGEVAAAKAFQVQNQEAAAETKLRMAGTIVAQTPNGPHGWIGVGGRPIL